MSKEAPSCDVATEDLELDGEHIYLMLASGRCHVGDRSDVESARSELPCQLWEQVDELIALAEDAEATGAAALATANEAYINSRGI